jgi:serine-type D-Ala-D-Ala carboxypeptidase/endopeptidase (penicillin-binding protein 4)
MPKHIIPIFIVFILLVAACNTETKKEAKKKEAAKKESITKLKPIDSLSMVLAGMQNDTDLANASYSFYIYDITKDTVLFQHNPKLSLVPASTIKVLTTATALEAVGGGVSFRTTLQYNGSIEAGHILKGNIFIKGGGDPTLGSNVYGLRYFMNRWVGAVKGLGVDSIYGAIIGDGDYFDYESSPLTWSYGEVNTAYCAGVSGLSIYDNVYQMNLNIYRKGQFSAPRGLIFPYVPNVRFESAVREAPVDSNYIYITGAPYGDEFLVTGFVPMGRSVVTVWGAIPDPPYCAAYELYSKLKANGVRISDSATTVRKVRASEQSAAIKQSYNNPRKEICSNYSPSLASIITMTNLTSNNFFAEHILKVVGLYTKRSSKTESGCAGIIDFWKSKSIDTKGMVIYDGSGVSRYNAVTAKQFVDVLLYMRKSNNFTYFYNSLPGSANLVKTLKANSKDTITMGRVIAKGGIMSRVRSFAGYVKCKSGKELAFALIANNFTCEGWVMGQKLRKIMVSMASL